ncbi:MULTISPECIES: hormogonium polysaccharide biosynthesis glycosyltransferase HpsP [Spirulina sp. CCY15215]|uniref:hormogonium polysaccharide biosynthesis glycosyltransferase HpsP n=1 Tax=Spirulina sp. CCY15215 TaxID=2767591 RepID=UPI001951559C|nr:hormogonium polysaccharide biosynthesis glycosyltransferase HpsP [Spirulina major]
MKVLQIIPSISLVYGGPSQMVRGLSAALVQENVEVTILTTDSNGDVGQPPLDVPLDSPVEENGYQIRYFHCSPFRRYKFSLGLLKWLAKHGKEYDLVHIHALFSPVTTAAAIVARNLNLPYILRPLGTLDPADLRKKKQLKEIYAVLWEATNLAKAAGVHFTSQEEARISRRFGRKTRDIIVPLGVELSASLPESGLARAKWKIDENIPLVLFMSRIDPKKGFDLLFPALAQLATEGIDFHFVLAGSNVQDPEYEQSVFKMVEDVGLRSRTTIAGFVQGEEKLALLRDADLFVLPSYYENFGIAVAEAMLAGIPVLISHKVYIWDTIQEADAGWVTQCDREDITEKLRSALQNPEQRRQKGENARNAAIANYSWDAIAQQMKAEYSKILQI